MPSSSPARMEAIKSHQYINRFSNAITRLQQFFDGPRQDLAVIGQPTSLCLLAYILALGAASFVDVDGPTTSITTTMDSPSIINPFSESYTTQSTTTPSFSDPATTSFITSTSSRLTLFFYSLKTLSSTCPTNNPFESTNPCSTPSTTQQQQQQRPTKEHSLHDNNFDRSRARG